MSLHHASQNWRNRRKNPEQGISKGLPEHHRNQVKALLSGSEDEALAMIRRHAENASFLRLALELEVNREPQRPTAIKLINQFSKNLAERFTA